MIRVVRKASLAMLTFKGFFENEKYKGIFGGYQNTGSFVSEELP
jgi:hypothetical protein